MVALRAMTLGTLISLALAHGAQADPIAQSTPVDAFINLGAGSYPDATLLTSGTAQPWYDSSQIGAIFGGQPTAQQIQSFDDAVVQRVQQTFQLAGINLTLTDNPSVPALHTLSLVSGAQSAPFPGSIGTTMLGGSGFSFIDQEAQYTQSLNTLEWIVAHNISHELMLAFGVPEQYDKTGNYIDATTMNWSTAVGATSTFSPAAAAAILSNLPASSAVPAPVYNTNNLLTNSNPWVVASGAQYLDPQPVPEPATIALWGLMAAGLVVGRYRRSGRETPTR